MPKVTEAIANFLRARLADHNGPDLLERLTPFMEVQVNVAAGNGEPVEGKRNTWYDGIYEYHSLRIPKNANSDPEFRDYELRFPLDPYVVGIGSTGWDWTARKSRWFGYDFDSIVSHAAGVGVTNEELNRVKAAAQAIPYVEVRRSTGGSGLHLYVYLDDAGIHTANHTEHAALARAILGMMSSAAGFDFARQIDVCGSNMWVWHRKMTKANQGLALLKAAEKSLSEADLPTNWKDHVDVVTRKRTKVRISAVEDDVLDPFEALTSSRKIIPLDDSHKSLIDRLMRSGFTTVWVPDHHLLQTHTKALEALAGDYKGFFQTNSKGNDPGTANCFAFPLEKGGWKVYRFSQGINEAETWTQDGDGWTTCYFNRQPDLAVAAKALGGTEDARRGQGGGFVFGTAEKAIEAAAALGQTVELPERMMQREARLKPFKGNLAMHVRKMDGDEGMTAAGWLPEKDNWVRVFRVKTDSTRSDVNYYEHDNVVRAITTPANERDGWVALSASGEWVRQPKDDLKDFLMSRGHSKPEVHQILGTAGHQTWTTVNLPFQPEYPGGRLWNRGAAQYRFAPADYPPGEGSPHPHWDMILKHCGQSLDGALRSTEWAIKHNIRRGSDYLLTWAACMLRHPFEQLPYLFLYGPQNSGKSILFESLALLMTTGAVSADRALTNTSEFNGELENAVLCWIDEKDISIAGKAAYNRIKQWVTGLTLSIRKMRTDSFTRINTTHWIQCGNERGVCPTFGGDTRMTFFFVPDLPPGSEIPKSVLIARLEAEAPYFMRTILDLQLPPRLGRLRLPSVDTEDKHRAQELNRCPLDQFLAEHLVDAPGHLVLFSEMHDRFREWLSPEDRHEWSKIRTARSLPDRYLHGVSGANKKYLANVAWEEVEPTVPYVAVNGQLKRGAA